MKSYIVLLMILIIAACGKDPRYEEAYYIDCDRAEIVECTVIHWTYHISKPNDTINKWTTDRTTNCGSYGWGDCPPDKNGIVYKWAYICPDCKCDTTVYWKLVYN